MNDIFYDPSSQRVTIAVSNPQDVSVLHETDGTILIDIENIDNLEFFWPDDKLWRAVK